jgi:hypothetical protein
MEERRIVRTEKAGVFFGKIKEKNGDVFILTNVRRLWRWNGAASLSELAMHGTSDPQNCKFPCMVDEEEVYGVIENIKVTEKAAKSIDGVKEWKTR